MTIDTGLNFAHFADALLPNFPDTGGSFSTSFGTAAIATREAGPPPFIDGASGKAVTFDWSVTDGVFLPGTGDFTVAVRFRVIAFSSNAVILSFGNTNGRTITISTDSGANRTLAMKDDSFGFGSDVIAGASSLTAGQTYTLVMGRDTSQAASNVGFWYIDNVDDKASEEAALTGRDYNGDGARIEMGAFESGGFDGNCEIEFAMAWSRVLDATERASLMGTRDAVRTEALSTGAAPVIVTPAGDQVAISDGPVTPTIVGSTRTIDLSGALQLEAVGGALVGDLAGYRWEWYDDPDSTSGSFQGSGTFASAQTTATLVNSVLADGQFGQLIVYHPTINTRRANYYLAVTVS